MKKIFKLSAVLLIVGLSACKKECVLVNSDKKTKVEIFDKYNIWNKKTRMDKDFYIINSRDEFELIIKKLFSYSGEYNISFGTETVIVYGVFYNHLDFEPQIIEVYEQKNEIFLEVINKEFFKKTPLRPHYKWNFIKIPKTNKQIKIINKYEFL